MDQALRQDPEPAALWYRMDVTVAASRLESDIESGLTRDEARLRRTRCGPNALVERGARSAWHLILDQLASTLVLVLVAAAGVSLAVGSLKDAIAILAIVALNAALGFIQEHRAERAMAALRRLAAPRVKAVREGQVVEVLSGDLVPGDMVLLEAGSIVPADGRVTESASLRIQEAVLTGESDAVEKRTEMLPGTGVLGPGDRVNMAFMGTTVAYGRGRILVTDTGMSTELGRVAGLIQEVGGVRTPLQQRLDRLGRILAVVALAVVALIFSLGVLAGEDLVLMFMTAVSMAVAVIPEGLPAVVTIALALGAQRMLKRRALIRRLQAVETLGSVTVICSDKTGTLTENRMTVTVLDLAGHRLDISEELKHRIPVTEAPPDPSGFLRAEPALSLLLIGGAVCNDAVLREEPGHTGRFQAIGDPTEGALVIAAARHGFLKDALDRAYPRMAEVPFDSDRKRMTTVHRIDDCAAWIGGCADAERGGTVVFTKGAVDSLLAVCSRVWAGEGAVPLDDQWRRRIAAADDELARSGMRVLGVAFRPGDPSGTDGEWERDLAFVGLVGMMDPPRTEARSAVAACLSAGIRPVMITGDHPVTARRIAEDLGIAASGGVVTGAALADASREELARVVATTSVFARVAPEQKLRIVEALQQSGQVVAMTGDGVNDAPALRRADIGVAMGITGTDVSKEAASMVLLDDNFATIVAAVEEGRAINDNIRRFLKFSLAGNVGKVLLVFLGPMLGMPLPLIPFQILWLNLVTDGVLGLGIGVEAAEPNVMRRPPQSPTAGVLSAGLTGQIVWMGLLLGGVNLGVAWWAYHSGQSAWQTIVMTTVVLLQVVEAHVGRSAHTSVFRLSPWSNRALLASTGLILLLQLLVIYLTPLQFLFGTADLSLPQLAVPVAAGVLVLAVMELSKRVGRN
jgi:Ca2+-transporting ATPase